MGLLVDGQWHQQWYDTKSTGGKFIRAASQFRNFITPDGQVGPTGNPGFKAESGRYHLYVSLACPWAHRTLIFRKLKGLEKIIDVSVVDYLMQDDGWTFKPSDTSDHATVGDRLFNTEFMHQIYTRAQADYSGRVTVPVLWDKQQNTVVNNESADIIRMFNSAFDGVGAVEGDYYPTELRSDIDAINSRIYSDINNGVYKAGFATNQAVYEQSVKKLFAALDWVEALLANNRYLTGEQLTEADWRLFTTLVRFEAVYVGHFKCSLKRLIDYPNINGFVRELYQIPGVAATVNFTHIKNHYYMSHSSINPTAIVPNGPILELDIPHQRNQMTE